MKKITIKAMNETGTEALKKHVDESKKFLVRARKLVFKNLGFTQEVICDDPLTLCMTINNRVVNNPWYLNMLNDEITKGLGHNGAKRDQDYSVEIEEVKA